ncbi:MAG: hypothetical protein RMK45_00335 [Armatimonadota bacterium]|nr:hypothetical protein [Armatimonadota bacterium]
MATKVAPVQTKPAAGGLTKPTKVGFVCKGTASAVSPKREFSNALPPA